MGALCDSPELGRDPDKGKWKEPRTPRKNQKKIKLVEDRDESKIETGSG